MEQNIPQTSQNLPSPHFEIQILSLNIMRLLRSAKAKDNILTICNSSRTFIFVWLLPSEQWLRSRGEDHDFLT